MHRVLVVMPNWFGETLFVTPFLRALHHHLRAGVTALGVSRSSEMLQHNPDVETFLPYDEDGRHRGWLSKARLAGELSRGAFDAAFILRKSLTRTLLLAAAKIPMRIGFANRKSGWLLSHRVEMPRGVVHKAHAYFALLTAVGISARPEPYRYTVTDEERTGACEWLRAQGLDGATRPLVVLHPGANWSHKRWLPERFAAVGNHLVDRFQARLLLTGGPDDSPLIRTILRDLRRPAAALVGATTVRRLAACLEQAGLVISNDTGVLHIASALGRPVAALYGPTSPAITGPLGDPARTLVLHHPRCCPQIPCFSPDRPPHPGMASISVDEVVNVAEKLLEC